MGLDANYIIIDEAFNVIYYDGNGNIIPPPEKFIPDDSPEPLPDADQLLNFLRGE